MSIEVECIVHATSKYCSVLSCRLITINAKCVCVVNQSKEPNHDLMAPYPQILDLSQDCPNLHNRHYQVGDTSVGVISLCF